MILGEERKLRLDGPVDDVLPQLANRKVLRTIDSGLDDTVPAKRPITVRDLPTYRSGYHRGLHRVALRSLLALEAGDLSRMQRRVRKNRGQDEQYRLLAEAELRQIDRPAELLRPDRAEVLVRGSLNGLAVAAHPGQLSPAFEDFCSSP
jgi:CubicO group peptidase (beta-lactamase class C family)